MMLFARQGVVVEKALGKGAYLAPFFAVGNCHSNSIDMSILLLELIDAWELESCSRKERTWCDCVSKSYKPLGDTQDTAKPVQLLPVANTQLQFLLFMAIRALHPVSELPASSLGHMAAVRR